tara:strand:+ start:420 stop:614 length:195 start_codon:yes stop_codon:yes gene_type:complete
MEIGNKVKVISEVYHDGLSLLNQYGEISGRIYLFKNKPPHAYYVSFAFIPSMVIIRPKNLELLK